MNAGPSVSGNPWPRFTEPVATASADISAKIVVVDDWIRPAFHWDATRWTLSSRLAHAPRLRIRSSLVVRTALVAVKCHRLGDECRANSSVQVGSGAALTTLAGHLPGS